MTIQSTTEQAASGLRSPESAPVATKMDSALKAKWIEALRSGEFKQGPGKLKRGECYCCLGVVCVVAGYGIDTRDDSAIFPDGTRIPDNSYGALDSLGIEDSLRGILIGMNDRGVPFPEIADYIEASL
jgi:hypothetical protein